MILAKKMLSILMGLSLCLSAGAQENLIVQEYYIFEVPQLPPTGPAFVSWFFFRSGIFWNSNGTVDLAEVVWPKWDVNQIPFMLVPAAGQPSQILIYDEAKELIKEINMTEPFSPEKEDPAFGGKAAYYRLSVSLSKNHLKLTTPFYIWPRKKSILKCSVDASGEDFKADKNRRLKVCLDTVRAYLSETNTDKRQLYISFEWASIKGRENISAVQEIERELRSGARKRKAVFLSKKTKGNTIQAEVGLTQAELLPKISYPVNSVLDIQRAVLAPNSRTVSDTLYQLPIEGGAELAVTGFYSDTQPERNIESPNLKGRRINVQFVAPPAGESPDNIVIRETRNLEQRTGLKGYMRPWQLLAFGGFNYLSSSRGENNYLFGLPGIDLKYNWKHVGLQPYFVFEKDVLHLGSPLEITELKVGISKQIPWVRGMFASAGYQEYSLSGKNPGTSRLGSLSALTAGIGASQRFEDWMLRQRFDLLFANSQSLDFRFDLGKFVGPAADSRLYIGTFFGYANYRAYVINKLNNKELFGESRFQVGLTIGWMGADSF